MKRLLLFPFLLVLIASCTTGKVRELPQKDYSLVRSLKFSSDTARAALLSSPKNYLIIFSAPVPEKDKTDLTVILNLPTGKEELFLNWTETGTIPDELLKYVGVRFGQYIIKDRRLIEEILNSIYAYKTFSSPYFYILGKDGRVAEIQGIDDYLRLELAARNKKLPDLSFFRQQITLASMRDVFGIDNEASRRLGAKLGLRMPFFLAVDDVITGLGMAKDLWLALTKDARAQKLLDSTASPRDRCLVIRTGPGKQLLFPSSKALRDVLATCDNYIRKEKPGGAEFVRLAIAEGRAFNVLALKHRQKFPEEEVLQIINRMKEAQKYARNQTERGDLDFTIRVAQNALSK